MRGIFRRSLLRVITSRSFVEGATGPFYGHLRLAAADRHAPAFMRDIIPDKGEKIERARARSTRARSLANGYRALIESYAHRVSQGACERVSERRARS